MGMPMERWMERELGSKTGAQRLRGLVTSEIHRERLYMLHGGGRGFLYIIFDRKGTWFVHLLLTNGTSFTVF